MAVNLTNRIKALWVLRGQKGLIPDFHGLKLEELVKGGVNH